MTQPSHTVSPLRAALRSPELWLLVLLFAAAMLLSVTENLSYTPDSARYVIWAQSLAEGKGYADWTSPEPLRYVVHAPLYSLVLAPVASLFGPSIEAMKVATILMGVSFGVLFYLLLRHWTSRTAAGITLAVVLLNPLTLHFSTQVLSEMLFALCFTGVLFAVEQWKEQPAAQRRYLVGTIVLVAGCILSREIGVVLVPVVIGTLLLRRRYEDAGWVFIGVILVFGAWYVRNEMIVAAREQPELRNSLLFVSNVLTTRDQSLWQELMMRFSVNLQFYGKEIGGLLFLPQFSPGDTISNTMYAVVDRDSALLRSAQMLVIPTYHLIALCSLGVAVLGAYRAFRERRFWGLPAGFLALYGVMILLYPVNDLRFLYPMLIVLLLWFAAGIAFLERMRPSASLWLSIICGAALVPNLLWGAAFVSEARMYGAGAEEYHRSKGERAMRSNEYLRPFTIAAQWIREQNDPSAVVISRWKELGIALPEKDVLVLDVFSSLERFERVIGEYRPRFIVMTRDAVGWHEFETHMARSKRYSFILERSVAAIDIYRIEPVTADAPKRVETRPMFTYLLHHLEQAQYDTLRTFYRSNRGLSAAHPYLRFFEGVMHELSGSYDSARTLFASLYGIPQGIVLSQQIGFHGKLIDQRMAAERSTDRTERAALLLNLALNYWELDLRSEAFRFLNATIREDAQYLPAYNLFVYCALMNQDTATARTAFDAMRQRFPQEPAAQAFSALFAHVADLHTARSDAERAGLYYHLSETYRTLGLTENSIESLREAVRYDGYNPVTAVRLAALLVEKRRVYPALELLRQTSARHPQSLPISALITELEARY